MEPLYVYPHRKQQRLIDVRHGNPSILNEKRVTRSTARGNLAPQRFYLFDMYNSHQLEEYVSPWEQADKKNSIRAQTIFGQTTPVGLKSRRTASSLPTAVSRAPRKRRHSSISEDVEYLKPQKSSHLFGLQVKSEGEDSKGAPVLLAADEYLEAESERSSPEPANVVTENPNSQYLAEYEVLFGRIFDQNPGLQKQMQDNTQATQRFIEELNVAIWKAQEQDQEGVPDVKPLEQHEQYHVSMPDGSSAIVEHPGDEENPEHILFPILVKEHERKQDAARMQEEAAKELPKMSLPIFPGFPLAPNYNLPMPMMHLLAGMRANPTSQFSTNFPFAPSAPNFPWLGRRAVPRSNTNNKSNNNNNNTV